MSAALQIWSHTFAASFDRLPASIQVVIQSKIDEMGTRLTDYPHHRLVGRPEFRLLVGDYRILYEFDVPAGRIYLHYVGHRRDIYKRARK